MVAFSHLLQLDMIYNPPSHRLYLNILIGVGRAIGGEVSSPHGAVRTGSPMPNHNTFVLECQAKSNLTQIPMIGVAIAANIPIRIFKRVLVLA